ncbi:MAG: cytochrome P460 family protein [Myxococcaceae bacterium]
MHRLVPAALLVLLACGGTTPTPDSGQPPPQIFIAVERDFAVWTNWQSFDLGDQPADTVHLGGHRTIYLNKAPPHGATAFPVGTIMVKTVSPDADGGTTPDGGTLQIFAMAKRGGEYNSDGAAGWEWFELNDTSQPANWAWRGTQPPAGQGYGGVAGGQCNTCHMNAAGNDCVESPKLALDNF